MNGIQIYLAILIGLAIVCGMALNGRPKTGEHNFVTDFIALLVMLPVYGRVFGWW